MSRIFVYQFIRLFVILLCIMYQLVECVCFYEVLFFWGEKCEMSIGKNFVVGFRDIQRQWQDVVFECSGSESVEEFFIIRLYRYQKYVLDFLDYCFGRKKYNLVNYNIINSFMVKEQRVKYNRKWVGFLFFILGCFKGFK